jgi:L-fucose isomerase-like protein
MGAFARPIASSEAASEEKVRIALVFFANSKTTPEMWPYPDFDCDRRIREVTQVVRAGCPQFEFTPVVVATPADFSKALALKDAVDGYLVYVVTLNWEMGIGNLLPQLRKPLIVADEFLGGCGSFLTGVSAARTQNVPLVAVSSTRLDDLLATTRVFAGVKQPGCTPATFARRAEEAYRQTLPAPGNLKSKEDTVALTDISECLERLRESTFLIVGAGQPGTEQTFLNGIKAIHVGFDEFKTHYETVDQDQAAAWGSRWIKEAEQVVEATPAWINKAGAMYLAMQSLMKKYRTGNITMNCLGGFGAGQIEAYPCLGFRQLLNDGQQGVCEAMPADTISMLMGRYLTGRPGYVSDPALDTSRNQICYSHCMAHTKVFGTNGPANPFRIRTLHNRDPRGCCAQSFMPAGYLTTSFLVYLASKTMVIHQARTTGNLDADRGCRTQLVGDVRGDIFKLFNHWDSWHRVTLYGDVKEPLAELGRALGLKIVEEA